MWINYIFALTIILCSAIVESDPVYPNKQRGQRYDYIVVGGGSAGAVIASRLSEDHNVSVLLLEAGGPPSTLSDIPYMWPKILGKPESDWMYKSEPQEKACQNSDQKRCVLPLFKGLGGGSTHNGMAYVRGGHEDFDSWESMGATGWAWKDVLPYFIKTEDNTIMEIAENGYHGTGGNLTVSALRYKTPLARAILEAGKELGQPVLDDYNGKSQLGFSNVQVTQRGGLRCGTEKAFLRLATQRPNLDVLVNAFVLKVEFDKDKRARSVLFEQNNQTRSVRANKEIILSAGAIGSPKILMLSGVGPASHLKEMGIPLVSDLPVGENLHEHPQVPSLIWTLNDSVSIVPDRDLNDQAVADLLDGKGPYTSPFGFETIIFLASKYQNQTHLPDILIHPVAASFSWSKTEGPNGDSLTIMVILVNPLSRGVVKLRSSNPYDPPFVDLNILAEEIDALRLIEGLKFALKIVKTRAILKYGPKLTKAPGCETLDEKDAEYVNCLARTSVETTPHYGGTVKMGAPDDLTTVLSPDLKVKGVQGLRVADASVMPRVVSANTNAAAIMIGEKAADIIKKSNKN